MNARLLVAQAQLHARWAALCRRAKRARYSVTGRLEDARFRALSWLLNRIATKAMRHAALLLGYEMALGHGSEDLLFGPLHEYTRGCEIAHAALYGDAAERAAAPEALRLEQMLCQPLGRRTRIPAAEVAR